jgi:hypothetical protein
MFVSFSSLGIGFLFFCMWFVYFLDITPSIENYISIKYRRAVLLKNRIVTNCRYSFVLFWLGVQIVAQTAYISLLQRLNRSVVKLDKNTYRVSYAINGICYNMIVKPKRGPKRIIQVIDQNDNDITEQIQAYMGPMENFHGTVFTPAFFNADIITVSLDTGDEQTFSRDQTINI